MQTTNGGRFLLRDWNDARILIACAEQGSFAAAAATLGQDQTTVSRRIGQLEAALGRPLFHRRRSGATPTVVGLALLERAHRMAAEAANIEDAIHGLAEIPEPTVTVGASEGLLAYTIKPALLGETRIELPLDRRLITKPLPRLAFTTDPRRGDVVVDATGPGELPKRQGSYRTRRIGTMKFVPVMAKKFWRERRVASRFDDLSHYPMIDIGIYRRMRGLAAWNALVDRADPDDVTKVANTPQIHEPLLSGRGITVLAPYSVFVDKSLAVLDLPVPDMSVSLWLSAHEDALREPEIRQVYDLLGTLFRSSAWFR